MGNRSENDDAAHRATLLTRLNRAAAKAAYQGNRDGEKKIRHFIARLRDGR